ncbi:MAG TPA: hypothetical protein VIA62_23760 [Thermoanaerobaculia bacterium]|jgi:hypothetical protein|nr:hypothetical protein [Thermoanaerobaculia bacterium]
MRLAVFALALLISALSSSAASAAPAQQAPSCQKGQSLREEDKTTGVVVQKTRLTPQPDTFDPLLVWTSDDPGSVTFAVLGNGNRARYPHCNGLTLVVDGRAVVMSKPKYQQEASGSRAVEYLTADIAWAEAEKIGAAKAIHYKICNDEFHAPPEFVCQARDVIESATAMRKAPAGKGPGR